MTDDENILICAVRYSLGRMTYIVARSPAREATRRR